MENAGSSSSDAGRNRPDAKLLCQTDGNTGETPPASAAHIIPPSGPLAGDILHGADQIAAFLYGDRKDRRKVYNLVETGRLPHFRLGANICARRSSLLQWITTQETAAGMDPTR